MRVRVAFTVDVTDEFREAINRYYGRPGLATREEVRSWFLRYGESMSDDLLWRHGDPEEVES